MPSPQGFPYGPARGILMGLGLVAAPAGAIFRGVMRTAEVLRSVEVRWQIDFDALSDEELLAMGRAGHEVLDVHRVLTKTNDNVVGEILRDQGTFYEWDHFPKGDVYDRETHGQYYYHAHPLDQRFEGEHGHFHTFMRPKGMPPWVKPATVPRYKAPKDPNDQLSHLIGISMDPRGFAFRLFTVNRWVTGEVWYDAANVATLLDYFKIDHARPSWPVNRWITAIVRLYKPLIVELVKVRDQTVEAWHRAHPEVEDVFEDRNLEVTSYADISAESQIRAVGQAIEARGLVLQQA